MQINFLQYWYVQIMYLIENNKSTTTFEFKFKVQIKGEERKENRGEKEKEKALRWVESHLSQPTKTRACGPFRHTASRALTTRPLGSVIVAENLSHRALSAMWTSRAQSPTGGPKTHHDLIVSVATTMLGPRATIPRRAVHGSWHCWFVPQPFLGLQIFGTPHPLAL
jgi:hypothetical protein